VVCTIHAVGVVAGMICPFSESEAVEKSATQLLSHGERPKQSVKLGNLKKSECYGLRNEKEVFAKKASTVVTWLRLAHILAQRISASLLCVSCR
jgi:hypothetical protein